jgi:uncharacterized protein YqeY
LSFVEKEAMSLKDRITEDMKTAMRAKEADRLLTIRIIDKLIKQRKDSIAAFQQAARTDLVDKESAELKVLEAYLPARLSAGEVDAAIAALVAELGASGPGDMGRVMAAAKQRLAGNADMGLVSGAVKRALAK